LMLRCELGVHVKQSYRVYRLDEDFFADEEQV
jgi:restriction endonuclease Mrr